MLIVIITLFLNYHLTICEGGLALVYLSLALLSLHDGRHAAAYAVATLLATLLALGSALAH